LQRIASTLLPLGIAGEELSDIASGWSEVASVQPGEEAAALAEHGRLRGARLFKLAAKLLDAGPSPDGLASGGSGWALVDLAARDQPALTAEALARARIDLASNSKWPRPLRPLGMLAMLARSDAERGLARRLQGSPRRMARMVTHYLTGR
jgi:phytoene synthase